MLDFLIDIIFVTFGGRVFKQTGGIPIGTYCVPLLVDLFLYYYETGFIQELLRKKDKKLEIAINFTFRYIDNVISINSSKFGDYVERIYPLEDKGYNIQQIQLSLHHISTNIYHVF